MYAVISDRNRQFTVRKGDEILCDLSEAMPPGARVTFDQVLLVGGEGAVRVGKPFVAGAAVTGEVLRAEKGEKLVVFKYKRRKNLRRKNGHRQPYLRVRIEEIRA